MNSEQIPFLLLGIVALIGMCLSFRPSSKEVNVTHSGPAPVGRRQMTPRELEIAAVMLKTISDADDQDIKLQRILCYSEFLKTVSLRQQVHMEQDMGLYSDGANTVFHKIDDV